jgi:hypothetical protein
VLEILAVKVLQDPYREICRRIRRKLFGLQEESAVEKKARLAKEKEFKPMETTRKIISM